MFENFVGEKYLKGMAKGHNFRVEIVKRESKGFGNYIALSLLLLIFKYFFVCKGN